MCFIAQRSKYLIKNIFPRPSGDSRGFKTKTSETRYMIWIIVITLVWIVVLYAITHVSPIPDDGDFEK